MNQQLLQEHDNKLKASKVLSDRFNARKLEPIMLYNILIKNRVQFFL